MTHETRFDPVPEKALREMLRNGQAYTNEVRAMADELLRLRAERTARDNPHLLFDPNSWFVP